ncbi:hypothetical protein D7X33_41075, partial [Butyricicoccus sp. 1XD8-22]
SNDRVIQKIDEQSEIYQQIANKIDNIEDTQKEVMNRVDGQEGITQKIIHQIDNIRFILFERTNYLEEKVEKIYQQAVEYFQKVKTGITQPADYVLTKKSEEIEDRDA